VLGGTHKQQLVGVNLAEAGVMLKTTCPRCREAMELPDEKRGLPIRCPHCQAAFRAPEGENQAATGGGGGAADAVLVVATYVGFGGLLLTAALLAWRMYGGAVPIPTSALIGALVIPMAVIMASWYGKGRTSQPHLVWVSRVAAYLWLLALVALLTRIV